MCLAQKFAGYSLAEADNLRKATGKKDRVLIAKEREKFVEGCDAQGYGRELGEAWFDIIEPFADYAFNKSHSYGYGFIAYQTAYLKANYPPYFMAALLTSERANTDKMVQYIGECREMGIRVLPPDVNESDMYFSVVPREPGGTGPEDLRFGLSAIRNVGEGAVEAVIASRREGGPFASLFDLCDRVDLRAVNRRVVESFVKSGSFDSVDLRRSAVFAAIDHGMEAGQRRQRDREAGQSSLFGILGAGETAPVAGERIPDAPPWSEAERLAFEKESLGFFISGHPLERVRADIAQWATATTGTLGPGVAGGEVTVGGLVTGLRLIKTKKGDRMASFVLEDLEGGVETLVFPEAYKKAAGRLADDQVVLVRGRAEVEEDGRARLLASDVLPLEQAKLAGARHVTIRVPVADWDREKGERLRDILGAHRGDCPVTLELVRPGSWALAVAPSAFYSVRPDRGLCEEVEALFGPGTLVLARGNGLRRDA